jgi:predicted S18 family serine protease
VIMGAVSNDLCDRSDSILERVERVGLEDDDEMEDIVNRTGKAAQAMNVGNYYSAASYCFGLNIRLRSLLYEKLQLNEQHISEKSEQLQQDIKRFEEKIRGRKLQTITDLQTFTVVMERLNDAKELLERIIDEDNDLFLLAFAEERYFSAQSWSRFFEMSGKKYDFDEALLHQSCVIKLQEARERDQYVQFFVPQGLSHINEGIARADEFQKEGEFEQCLITASEAKADANAILSIIGVQEDQLPRLLKAKTNAIEHLIARTVDAQAFPLLGFSYYQYAQSLEQYDIHSALLYTEYALEMSNLDIYFEEDTITLSEQKLNQLFTSDSMLVLLIGFALGLMVASFAFYIHHLHRKWKRK